MNRGQSDSQYSDSIKMSNFNQAGLEEAEQNYFIKYANSGFSQVNNQRIVKRVETKVVNQESGAFSKIKSTQNEVLRQLKQEYQILRNLPIQDKVQLKSKPKREITSDYSSSVDQRSDLTSSKRSGHKKGSRDAQILALQKKQLQIVISNSLKKIEELLQNQMQLKKMIHELRLQIEGKGGINSEYQIQIRSFKKTEKQLKQNIETLKLEMQRKNSAIKQLGQKVAYLQGQKSRRQQEHRNYFDDQRKMDDLLRKQKDKSMNSELQAKRLQMEFQIYQKDKTAQINRLVRQLQTKEEAPERDYQTIRRLQQQINIKDHKIEAFVQQIDTLRTQINIRPVSPPPQPQDNNKNIFQQLVKVIKAKNQAPPKDNNEGIVKAILQKLGNRKDQTLKNEISSLRVQLQSIRRNSTISEVQHVQLLPQVQLPPVQMPQVQIPQVQVLQVPQVQSNPNQQLQFKNRIKQLQRIIDEQKRQKRALLQQIDKLKSHRDQIFEECQSHRRRVRQYKQTQQKLLIEIQELGNFKIMLQESKIQNQQIKQKLETVVNKHQVLRIQNMKNVEPVSKVQKVNSVQNEQVYQNEIRQLKRKNDSLAFQLNKVNLQKSFNQNIIKQSQEKQILRLTQDLSRYKLLLKNKQDQLARITQQLKSQVQIRDKTIQNLKQRFEQLDKKNRQTFESSRGNYQSLLKAEVSKHYTELQSMNQKIIELTKTNETFTSQGQYYTQIQRQVNELRRLVKNQKRMNEAVDHLWEIKEAQYNNINQILTFARN